MTAKMLLEQYMAERHALGFVSKTDEGCIRRFLRDYKEPEDGKIVFSKEYVLEHIGTGLNQKASTVLRDVSAINGFLNFVIRKGFTAYKIPPKFMPKEVRNFRAYIFTDTEIEKMFNCGLRTSELLNLRVCDVDFTEKVLAIRDTKFHKSRLVPFTDAVAIPLANYLELFPPASNEAILFASCCSRSKGERYGASWIHTQFRTLLRMSEIPYGGPDRGPRPHDMRHTFAVHCLNSWVLAGEDLTAGLPVLSTYLGHNDLSGTQRYLQLTAQMYPDITQKLEKQFGELIPTMEVPR